MINESFHFDSPDKYAVGIKFVDRWLVNENL